MRGMRQGVPTSPIFWSCVVAVSATSMRLTTAASFVSLASSHLASFPASTRATTRPSRQQFSVNWKGWLPSAPFFTTVCSSGTFLRSTPQRPDHDHRQNMGTSPSAAVTSTTGRPAPSGPALPPLDPTAKRLFLVRHGEVINPGADTGRSVYYGALDVPLSPLGQEEARVAAKYLQQFPLARIFSSPLSRAVFGAEQVRLYQQQEQLASPIPPPPMPETPSRVPLDESWSSSTSTSLPSSSLLPPVIILEGFKELDRGAWCGQTKEEIGPDLLARFDACDESVTPAGGESYPQLKDRVLRARDQALGHLSPGQAGCLVSHLQVTRCLLSDALGVPTHQMTLLQVATASVTCIDYYMDPDRTQLLHFQSYKPEAGLVESKDGAN